MADGTVLTAASDRTMRLWRSGKCLRVLTCPIEESCDAPASAGAEPDSSRAELRAIAEQVPIVAQPRKERRREEPARRRLPVDLALVLVLACSVLAGVAIRKGLEQRNAHAKKEAASKAIEPGAEQTGAVVRAFSNWFTKPG
jgi:hypothetical protein